MIRRIAAALLGVGLVAVLVASAVHVGTHHASYEAVRTTAGDAAEPTAVADLPAECRPFARSLAAGERVSTTEHRIGLAPAGVDLGSVVLGRTPGDGWAVRGALCGPALNDLGPSDPLAVDGRTYRLLGSYERTTDRSMPVVGAARVVGVVLVPSAGVLWAVGRALDEAG